MDLSFLPTPVTECNKRTGAHFTVRSANSPSYSLTRRPGVRKQKGERYGTNPSTNGENQEDGVAGYQARTGGRSSVKDQQEEKETSGHEMFPKLSRDDTGDKMITVSALESQGRTEKRRFNLSSKSQSLDWRMDGQSPVWGTRADTIRGGDINKQPGGLDERGTRAEAVRGRLMPSIHVNNSAGGTNVAQERNPVSHLSQTLDRVSRGHSLPYRLRSQSGPGSWFTETATSFGPKGGQSILERIEKLYGSAGFGKAEDNKRFLSVDEVGLARKERERSEWEGEKEADSGDNCSEDFGKYARLKSALEIPLNGGAQRRRRNVHIDETDFAKVSSPEDARGKDITANNTPSSLPSSSSDTTATVQKVALSGDSPPASDDDTTPTNTPNHSPLLSPTAQMEKASPIADTHVGTSVFTHAATTPDPDSSPPPRPLAASSHSNLPDLISPDDRTAHQKRKKKVLDLDAWVAGLNSAIKVWNADEDYEDDDESTQKDDDSNYDSDSGESSVTITSNMSQSDHRSFCVSLSDLCNFAGVDYESENDSDEWQSTGRRSASLSSDVSALSYVSVMPSEELDRLLEDVRSLGDNNLQDYDDVQVAVLHKEVGVGLGFSVAGGVDQNKPVTVHRVFHSGVAAQQGSIREGDQVLSINGTALCGHAHWEVLRVLRRAKNRETGVVVLRRGGVSGVPKSGVQTSVPGPTQTLFTEQMCVCLEKNSRDLGFSLEGGVGSSLGNRPLTVQKIFQGGPVEKVCPGDQVLEIEGVSVVGMRRLEAWALIRKLPPGPVDVILCRPLNHQET
uniref:PDZ domain-containing protein n=1 Tax=Scophthalmus maximus TaxID=52904 RepID=A0A8D3B3U8_SCOMX